MTYPDSYRYTKEHEWIRVEVRAEGDIGIIGITFHAQKELGDIVYVELPKTGALLEQGKSMGSVESVKAVSDVYAPISGEVIEVNETLAQTPEKLNQDPHGEAWLVKVRMSAPNELTNLISSAEYQEYIGAETGS
jgi:glycine cleavage system H protein